MLFWIIVISGICPNCGKYGEWYGGKCANCGWIGTPLNDE